MNRFYKEKNKWLFAFFLLSASYFSCRTNDAEPMATSLPREAIINEDSLEQVGQEIVQISFQTLSAALTQQIKDSGAVKAISYCNANAYPLIDSLANKYGVSIKRTSYSLRNENNAPTQLEKDILFNYHANDTQGNSVAAFLHKDREGTYHYYAPIYVMDACTKCHGVANKTLDSLAYSKIMELYPQDEATGYKSGDLRGMWSVSF